MASDYGNSHTATNGKTRWHGHALILLLGLIVGVGSMTTDIYFPAMPILQQYFSVDAPAIQTTLSIFLIGLASGQLVFGPLSDHFGRRPLILAGLVLYVLGCLLAVLAPSLWILLAARLLQGLGASAGIVVVRATVTDRFEGQTAARIHSLLMQIMAIASIAAPVLGGWIVVIAEWQTIFKVLATFGSVCLLACLWLLKESLPVAQRTDSPLTAQLGGWLNLLHNRDFVLLSLASGFTVAAMYALLMGSSFSFVDQFAWSPANYGLLYAGTSAAFVSVGFLNDRALRTRSPMALLTAALPVQLALCLFVVVAAHGGWLTPTLLGALLIIIVGNLALIHGNLVAVVMEHARSRAGVGAGLLGVTQYGLSAFTPLAAEVAGGTPLISMSLSTAFFALLAMPCFWFARQRYLQYLRSSSEDNQS